MKTIDQIIAEVDREIKAERRYETRIRRKEKLRRTVDALPHSTLKTIQRQLRDPEHNKSSVAKAHGLPHNLIVWIWRHNCE